MPIGQVAVQELDEGQLFVTTATGRRPFTNVMLALVMLAVAMVAVLVMFAKVCLANGEIMSPL